MNGIIDLVVWPRKTITWEEFLETTPENSIALDGVVSGGPNFDEESKHVNFDHHDNVVRSATMSACKQVYFAVKGGLFELFREDGKPKAHVYVNDSDQDTSLAVALLENYKLFEGIKSVPVLNRLVSLTDELDITGGAFPQNFSEKVLRQHNWVFAPYTELSKSGALATATLEVIQNNIESVVARVNKLIMGEAGESPLDTRHEILYESPFFKVVDEIGGTEARHYLFSQGMDAFISLVNKPEGKFKYSIGRRSRYIPFPVTELYDVLNKAEGSDPSGGWGGSDIIGGSSREHHSKLEPLKVAKIVEDYCIEKYRRH